MLFRMPHSGHHFLRFECDLVPKRSILGVPWHPAGPKMAIKITQVAAKGSEKNIRGAHFLRNLKPTCSQGRFRSAPGHHFGRFASIFNEISYILAACRFDFRCISGNQTPQLRNGSVQYSAVAGLRACAFGYNLLDICF